MCNYIKSDEGEKLKEFAEKSHTRVTGHRDRKLENLMSKMWFLIG